MSETLKAKLLQFLADEAELLEDFAMDVDDQEDNKSNAKAVALWSMQSIRVGAIRDVLEMAGVSEDGV